MEEAATPLPSEETTPPVTNIYFGAIRVARAVTRSTTPDFYTSQAKPLFVRRRIDVHTIMSMARVSVNSKSLRGCIQNISQICQFFSRSPRSETFCEQAGLNIRKNIGRKRSLFFDTRRPCAKPL